MFGGIILPAQALAQPQGVDGWQQAKWGMSKEEILKAFEGKANEMNETIRPEKFNIYSNISIDNIDIAGKTCKAEFYMDNHTNKLTRVHIKPIDADENTFREFEIRLVHKYGSPINEETTKQSYGAYLERTWFFPSITIRLINISVAGIPFITLQYLQNAGDDKL